MCFFDLKYKADQLGAEVRQEKDQPIIMMSEGFVKMTGYQLEDALTKNCVSALLCLEIS